VPVSKIFIAFDNYSGLGYVVGRGLAMAFDGDWHWALRGTPVLGLLAVILIVFVMKEPPRGEAEGHDQVPILPKVYVQTCNL
jgi:hypothetical protein